MATLNLNRDSFAAALGSVAAVIERSQIMPVLENVLIRVEAGACTLSAQDQEIEITARVDDAQGAEDFALTVRARELLTAVTAAPDEALAMSTAEHHLRVRSGSMSLRYETLPADAWPLMHEESDRRVFTLAQGVLKRMLTRTHHAMALNDARYFLNGTLFDFAGGRLTVVTTDGHRLGTQAMDVAGETGDYRAIVPRKAVLTLMRLLDSSDSPVTIAVGQRTMAFDFGAVHMLSKLVDGQYPDWTRIVPQGHPIEIDIDRKRLLAAVKRAAIVGSDLGSISMSLADNRLTVFGRSKKTDEIVDEIELSALPSECSFHLNPRFLTDVLSDLEEDTLRLALGIPDKAMKLTLPDTPDFLYLIMPIRG